MVLAGNTSSALLPSFLSSPAVVVIVVVRLQFPLPRRPLVVVVVEVVLWSFTCCRLRGTLLMQRSVLRGRVQRSVT